MLSPADANTAATEPATDATAASTKVPPPANGGGDSDSEEEEEEERAPKSTAAPAPAAKSEGDRYDRLERLKREKRLAQNRDCARARRRRKKMRMELLENRVQTLTQTNQSLQADNETLMMRVAQLEGELRRMTAMAMGAGPMGGAGMGAVPSANAFLNASKFGGGAGGAPFLDPAELHLQRRAAMVGLGGATTGLGGGGAGADPNQLRYLQLMQQAKAGGGAGGNPGAGAGPGGAGGAAAGATGDLM